MKEDQASSTLTVEVVWCRQQLKTVFELESRFDEKHFVTTFSTKQQDHLVTDTLRKVELMVAFRYSVQHCGL